MKINFKKNNLMSGLKGQFVQKDSDYRVPNVRCTITNMWFSNQPTGLFTNQCSSTRWIKNGWIKKFIEIMDDKSSTGMKK